MGVYHITYTPELKEICLYFDGGCQFSCHGCITDYYPQDCHLEEQGQTKNKNLSIEEAIFYLKPLFFKKVVFLGKEPTVDLDFLPLAKILKEKFSAYNTLLTNGYEFIEGGLIDEVCVSIKAITPDLFKDFTGQDDPIKVLKNFKRYVSNLLLKARAESVFIPRYIDKDEIEKIAKFIASVNSSLPYRIDGYITQKEDKFRRPTEDEMKKARAVAEKYLKNVSILHSEIKVRHKVERIY